jgi:hypothetical protein
MCPSCALRAADHGFDDDTLVLAGVQAGAKVKTVSSMCAVAPRDMLLGTMGLLR